VQEDVGGTATSTTIQNRFGSPRKLPREKPVNASLVIEIVAPW
jgi:hypothetical protein